MTIVEVAAVERHADCRVTAAAGEGDTKGDSDGRSANAGRVPVVNYDISQFESIVGSRDLQVRHERIIADGVQEKRYWMTAEGRSRAVFRVKHRSRIGRSHCDSSHILKIHLREVSIRGIVKDSGDRLVIGLKLALTHAYQVCRSGNRSIPSNHVRTGVRIVVLLTVELFGLEPHSRTA